MSAHPTGSAGLVSRGDAAREIGGAGGAAGESARVHGSGGLGGEAGGALECSVAESYPGSDFVVMQFENQTSDTLYLASTNPHCGAWPAFVDFTRDGVLVDIHGGDCLPYCSRLIGDSGNPGTSDCAGPVPCPTPFQLIPPGGTITQFVFPWSDEHHELPGSCVSDEGRDTVSCVTVRDLPAVTYSLRATAYRALSCGTSACLCDESASPPWCVSPEGTPQPRGEGAPVIAQASVDLSSPVRYALFELKY